MDKKFKKNILKILKEKQGDISIASLEDKIAEIYNLSKNKFDFFDFSDKLTHILNILEQDSLIIQTKREPFLIGISPKYSEYIELTSKGYEEFKPFYIKTWNFIKSDFLIILTIISTLLGITGTVLALIALGKN